MTRQEIPVFKTREENVAYMNETLPIQESFDLIQRDLLIGGRVSSFYFVNGFTANSDDLEIIRNGGEYEIKEGRLIVGNHSNPLPKNWEDRSEKYKKAYDVFGK